MAATLRELVQGGQAQVEGTSTIDGVPSYKLGVSGGPDRFLLGTVYVAQNTYYTLLIQTTTLDETIRFQAYEYLPATDANLKLLDVAAAHPNATVVASPTSAKQ